MRSKPHEPCPSEPYWSRKSGGFTLLALVLNIVLMGVVALLVTQVLGGSMELWTKVAEGSEKRAAQVSALERMTHEVRAANDINTCGNSTLEVNREEGSTQRFEANNGQLTLGGEDLSKVDANLCERRNGLIHLSISDEINAYVYPRNDRP